MSRRSENHNVNDIDESTTSVSWTGDTNATTQPSSFPENSSHSSHTNEHADTSVTTFDIHPSSNSNSNNSNSNNTTGSTAPSKNTAQWTRYLPEAFGIRHSVESSKYRWCARESAMWGIATGTTMAFHRLRMNSPLSRVIHVGFGTVFVVMGGSYYFCVKRRNYQEQIIELLMQLNTFEPVQNMPKERKINDHNSHPFIAPIDSKNSDHPTTSGTIPTTTKQYVAHLPERKEWQTQMPTQDAANVFQPYNGNTNNDDDDDDAAAANPIGSR